MADVTASLYEGQPGTSTTLLYTNADANPTIVKSIVLVNTTGSSATVTIGASNAGAALAAANYLVPGVTIAANAMVCLELWKVLENGGTIRGLQGTSAAITVHIGGVRQ